MKRLSFYLVLSLAFISVCMARPKKKAPKNLIDDPKEMAIAFAEDEMKRFPELWMYDFLRIFAGRWRQRLSLPLCRDGRPSLFPLCRGVV